MKTIRINIAPIYKQVNKLMPNKVVITKAKIKKKVKDIGKELRAHFKQKDAWPIRASEYDNDVLYPFFKTNVSDYINYLILKELGKDIVLTMNKSRDGENFWGFRKDKKCRISSKDKKKN